MLGILYLILCAAFGMSFVGLAVPDVRRLYTACSTSAKAIRHIPNTLFTVPAGIITGMMCVPFFNYYVTLGLSYLLADGEICKKLGVLITFAFFLWMILTCLILINRKRVKREAIIASGSTAIEEYRFSIIDSIFYGIVILGLTITATFLMFYTYRVNGDSLMNGYSTFSDLSPHTAMVSSFGKGFNFPTQYMHFSGNGIRYHFLFYFLAGTLQYLGMPIDYALNMPSIISMVSALVLLGLLAMLISSRRAAFLVAPVLVFLRSSLNVFYHIREQLASGTAIVPAIKNILAGNSWYEVTPYDNWGIWAINVYPNQRHLMLGIAVILILVILFLPFVRRLGISVSRAESFGQGVKNFAFSRNAWLARTGDPLYPVSLTVLACVLLIVMPYFHGSCLIALLLVLFGMAVFSESRLLYLAAAVCAVASSYIQTMVFSGGYQNVVTFEFNPGFILEDMNVFSLLRYLFIVTGLTLILGAVFALAALITDIVRKKPVYRFLLFICSLMPMAFAFIFKVSLEMLANHKFIQVSLILVDAFVAGLIANLLFIPLKRRKKAGAEDSAASDDDIIDADAADGEIAIAAAVSSGAVRTPALPEESAFGQSMTEPEELPDIAAVDAHTGIDADISVISGDAVPELSDGKEPEDVKESSETVEEAPSEIMFGDNNGDQDSPEDDDDAEAKAGVAALAALFGDDTGENNEATASVEAEAEEISVSEEQPGETVASDETTTPADSVSETSDDTETVPETADAADTSSEEETDSSSDPEADPEVPAAGEDRDETDETDKADEPDDSDDAVMASTPEPAHFSMRPGSMIAHTVSFGDDEPEDDEDANVAIESSDESTSDSDDEAVSAAALKHEPIKEKKAKGLPLPAWIALELAGVILALALMVPLTATGVSEWATYINLNSTPMNVDMNSPVTKWVLENTDPSDVFLTPEWSMNRFILAGRPMYYGWPYYAWSAGHDTYTRDTIYLWLITGCGGDINEFTRYCKERGIRYLVDDPEFEHADFGNGISFNKEFFEENLTQAAYFAEEDTTIYRIY